jgi:hypothetical protein
MDVDRCWPGRRRDHNYAYPRQRRGLPDEAAARLPHIRGRQGLSSLSSRLTVIVGAIVLLACHLLTERSGQRAHR